MSSFSVPPSIIFSIILLVTKVRLTGWLTVARVILLILLENWDNVSQIPVNWDLSRFLRVFKKSLRGPSDGTWNLQKDSYFNLGDMLVWYVCLFLLILFFARGRIKENNTCAPGLSNILPKTLKSLIILGPLFVISSLPTWMTNGLEGPIKL